MIVYDHASQFFWLPANFLGLVCKKNVSGGDWRLHSVCSFWEAAYQFGNSNHSIIDFVSFYITGGLTNARKRLFNLHLMNTEDHLFPHNGLRANIFSTLDAGPSCSIQNPLIDSDCCDKQQPRGFWVNESKYL
jgi:hypothetical protein